MSSILLTICSDDIGNIRLAASPRSSRLDKKQFLQSIFFADEFSFVIISSAWRQQYVYATFLRLTLKCGSYATFGLRHRASIVIASLRATATLAFFLAILPPLWAIRLPKSLKSQSSPNGPIIYCAPCTSSLLNKLLPHFVIPSCLSTSPD